MTMTVLDRASVTADPGRVTDLDQARLDPEVPERARRRTFTAGYKLAVLAAYDAAGPGEKGALLRREGLYSSHIVDWRRARDAGALAGLAAPRGRPRADRRDAEIARLNKDKARLEQELAKARFVVRQTCRKQGVGRDQLTLHADRGSSMPPSRSRCCSPTSASPSRTPART